jgi:hypothetical protein
MRLSVAATGLTSHAAGAKLMRYREATRAYERGREARTGVAVSIVGLSLAA